MVDVTQVIMGRKGEPLKFEEEVDLTLRDIIVETLYSPQIDSQTGKNLLDAKAQMTNYRLAQKIDEAEKTVDLTHKQWSTITDLIHTTVRSTLQACQAVDMIEGKPDEQKDDDGPKK